MVSGVCGTRRNARTSMSRCVFSSSAKAVSTDARRGLRGALTLKRLLPAILKLIGGTR